MYQGTYTVQGNVECKKELIRVIGLAKRSLRMAYYLYCDPDIHAAVLSKLRRARHDGTEPFRVYCIFDQRKYNELSFSGQGPCQMKIMIDELIAEGARVVLRLLQSGGSMHRKLVTIDGHVVMTGPLREPSMQQRRLVPGMTRRSSSAPSWPVTT